MFWSDKIILLNHQRRHFNNNHLNVNFAAIKNAKQWSPQFRQNEQGCSINYCEQMNEQDSLAEWIRDHKDVHLNGHKSNDISHSNLLPYAISTNTKLSMVCITFVLQMRSFCYLFLIFLDFTKQDPMWFVQECVRAVRAYCSKCEICTRMNLMNSHSMNEWIDGWLSSNQSKKWKRWRRESIVRGSGHTIELYIYILSRHLYGSIAVYSPVLFVDGVVVAACSLVLFTPNHLSSVKGTASIPYESYNTRSRTEFRVYFLPWGTKLFSFRLPLFSFFLSPHFLSSFSSCFFNMPFLQIHCLHLMLHKCLCIGFERLCVSFFHPHILILTVFIPFIRLYCLVMRQAWYINCCYCCRRCCRFCSVASISWTESMSACHV